MELYLRANEVELLQSILSKYLSDLRMEIVSTEEYDLRQDLKQDEVMVKELLERLRHSARPAA